MLLLTIIPVLGVLLLVYGQSTREQQLVRQNVETALNQATESYRIRQNQVNFYADWLSDQDEFTRLVETEDRGGLRAWLTRRVPPDNGFFILVWNEQGKSLVQAGRGSPFPHDGKTSPDFLDMVFSGREAANVVVDSSGSMSNLLTSPLYQSDSHQLVGAFAVGFSLEEGLLQNIPTIHTNQESIVLCGERFVYARLTDKQGMPLVGSRPDAELIQAARTHTPTDFVVLDTPAKSFAFKFVPLPTDSTSPPMMLGIGVPRPSLAESLAPLLNPATVLFLFVFVGVSAIGYLYVMDSWSSLKRLNGVVQRMATGDFSKELLIGRLDEIGDLEGGLERVRSRHLAELQEAQSRQENHARIASVMGIAATQTDPAGNLVWVNPAAEELLGHPQEQLVGKPWRSLFESEDKLQGHRPPSAGDGSFERMMSPDAGIQVSARLPLRMNPRRRVSVISSPVVVENSITGFVHVLLDSSSQDELLRSRDEFLMHAAHELRAPLTKLRVSVELFAETFRERNWEQLHSLLDNMQRTMFQFQFFVENLIDIGNLQAGHFLVYPNETEFKTILDSALDQFQPFVHSKWQVIDVQLDLPSPCYVMADRTRVVQVLLNLLSNAIKYGAEGKPIVLRAFATGGKVITEVTDYGPGIPAAELERIFQRFYRGKRAEVEGLGVGLGLAIAREIVVQHGGEIHARSRVGEETTFWFSLPISSAVPIESR